MKANFNLLKLLKSNRKNIFYFSLFLLFLVGLRIYVFSFSFVEGSSMEPTIKQGDIALVWKWNKKFEPGDIVVVLVHRRAEKIVKRLIAGPNSEIYINDFKVYVNGQSYNESQSQPPYWNRESFECRFTEIYRTKQNEFFVMGDNRCASADSRFIGAIFKSEIVGKVGVVFKTSYLVTKISSWLGLNHTMPL